MQLEDMILISVDDHVVEPRDMWVGRVPKKYAEEAPRLVMQENGTEAWEYLGQRSTNIGLNAVAAAAFELQQRLDGTAPCSPAPIVDIRRGSYFLDGRHGSERSFPG